MSDLDTRTAPRRRFWLIVGSALILAFAVLSVVAVVRGSWTGEHVDGSGTSTATPAATAPLPEAQAPYSRIDDVTLTVPEEARFATGSFWGQPGEIYLVTMDLQSMKPEGSGGRSMYLGVTLSCSPQAGGPGISVGGTQNMLTGETTGYANQGLVTVPEGGAIDCSIKVSAPYGDVASNGTTFAIDATWRAESVDGEAVAADEEQLPRTLAAEDDGAVVLTAQLPLAPGDRTVRGLASLHLTTCTGVNGSREDGRAWCTERSLDESGSTVQVELRTDVLDADGEVCETLGTETTQPDSIDIYRHHRLLSLDVAEEVPAQRCGPTVRVTARVFNDGPAPLVVHRSNSSLVVVGL
ncbi:hypothetical protein [Brachybacterium saurashtrense]|uniref:Uncharacterized protein n=1 Tax=Brachybacterium saurashtrense TaxID=556288 RepID=A0A345YQJ1_9MICO|nr:hypothetical protein [Brachybacterium saurashtrense]AXK46193.1 hypothetical protein DWV08_11625 [Brachybacterium saurashtrense]RRR23933.1 hypothetical protein DXU92_03375 [Brachybacterium saurashtrense]